MQVCEYRGNATKNGTSIGSKDNVTYTVNNITRVNISATYFESKR